MLEPFERFVGRPNAPVTAVGGGAQSDLWCQILADATGRTIRQPETPIQANAMGAAFIAAVGLGAIRFEDVPGLMRWRRTYTPDPGRRGLYDERFGCFKEAHRRLAPLYRRLNAPRRTRS
jgi:xylulokinase